MFVPCEGKEVSFRGFTIILVSAFVFFLLLFKSNEEYEDITIIVVYILIRPMTMNSDKLNKKKLTNSKFLRGNIQSYQIDITGVIIIRMIIIIINSMKA